MYFEWFVVFGILNGFILMVIVHTLVSYHVLDLIYNKISDDSMESYIVVELCRILFCPFYGNMLYNENNDRIEKITKLFIMPTSNLYLVST